MVYLTIKYAPIIGQKFEEPPLFLPLRVVPPEKGELVEFCDRGRAEARGQLPAGSDRRSGPACCVYCHEFLSDRWSYPALHRSTSATWASISSPSTSAITAPATAKPGYSPMHWASDREVRDLRAALAYLRSRPDRDPAGFGLFGVSRGGTTALLVTPAERDVWGVITDGAFPTIGDHGGLHPPMGRALPEEPVPPRA